MVKRAAIVLLLIGQAGAMGIARAQTAAPAPSQVAPPLIQPAPSAPTRILLPQVQAGGQIPAEAKKLFFVLIGIDITGEFDELVATGSELRARIIGKRVSVAEIFDFANKLQEAYVRAGYPLVRVVIPPQELAGSARVKVRVIDGFVERIDASAISGPVRARVEAVAAPLLRQGHLKQAELERRLLLAGEAPGLVLNSIFTAGKEIGGSVLVLSGRYRPVSASIYVDDAMPKEFGTTQVVTSIAENGLAGFGEQLLVSAAGYPDEDFIKAHPTRRYLSGLLTVPIGTDGWKTEIFATSGKTTPRVTTPAAATFGTLDQLRVKIAYEAIKRRDVELTINGRYEAVDERIDALAFTPPIALNLDRVRALRGGIDGIWRQRETGTTLGYGADISRGLDALGARTAAAANPLLPLSRAGADAVFTKATGRIEVNQALPENFFINFGLFGQTSFGKPLLVSEQYDIVGAKMLSGFTAGALPGDTAWTARAELGRPFAVPSEGIKGTLLLTPYVFAATGERILEQPTVLEFGSVHASNFGIGLRSNLAGVADFLPDSYAFVEASHTHRNLVTPPMTRDGSRIFAGALVQY